MNSIHRNEQGSALFITLIMLVMITLFAISMINTNLMTTKSVSAQQSEKNMEKAAEQAIERFISTSANFTPAPTAVTPVTVVTPSPTDTAANTMTVNVSVPRCLGEATSPGFSLCSGFNCPPVPKETVWEISATATDPATGASAHVAQGVKVRLPPGNC